MIRVRMSVAPPYSAGMRSVASAAGKTTAIDNRDAATWQGAPNGWLSLGGARVEYCRVGGCPRWRYPLQRRCKSFYRQGLWREALSVWDQLHKKNLPVHQGLRKACLLLKAADMHESLLSRQSAQREADAIVADLEALFDLTIATLDADESE